VAIIARSITKGKTIKVEGKFSAECVSSTDEIAAVESDSELELTAKDSWNAIKLKIRMKNIIKVFPLGYILFPCW
jgi:hypothetical protein